MNNKEVNINKGCLPFFLVAIILFVIRFQVAPGKSWEKGFTDFSVTFYWIGVVYMVLAAVVNKANEHRQSSHEVNSPLPNNYTKKNTENSIDQSKQLIENQKLENSKLHGLRNSWIKYNENLL